MLSWRSLLSRRANALYVSYTPNLANNIPYQPLLIKTHIQLTPQRRNTVFSKLCFSWPSHQFSNSIFFAADPSPDVLNSLPVYFRLKPTLRTPSGRRCRKSRTVFTDLQLRVLEKTFSEQKYLDTSNRGKLAQTLGLNETQVKTWFQNRRMKWKKENNKSSITEESPESIENKEKAGSSEEGASALSNGQENSTELAAKNPTE